MAHRRRRSSSATLPLSGIDADATRAAAPPYMASMTTTGPFELKVVQPPVASGSSTLAGFAIHIVVTIAGTALGSAAALIIARAGRLR